MQFPEVCALDQHGKGIDVRLVIEMTRYRREGL